MGRLCSTAGGGTGGVGVCIRCSGGVAVLLFLLTPSVRTARAGSLRFLSMMDDNVFVVVLENFGGCGGKTRRGGLSVADEGAARNER